MTSILRTYSYFTLYSRFHPFSLFGRNRRITYLTCSVPKQGQLKHDRSVSSHLFSECVETNSKPKQNIGHILQDCDITLLKHLKITRRKVNSILNQFFVSNSLTGAHSLFLLKCCGNLLSEELLKKRTELVQKVWKKLEDRGTSLTTQHYNTLMSVHFQNEHPYDPAELFKNMKKKNVKPDKVSYQRLITAHCSKGDMEGAFFILDEMKRLDLPIGKPVFDALIAGYSLNKNFGKVDATLADMSQFNIEPDHNTYRGLLCSYAMHNRIEHITSTLGKCREQNISLHDSDLLSVVYSAAMNGHINLVDTLLVRMPKHLFYNQLCIDVILRLINQKREDAAFRVLLSMKRSAESTRQPLDAFFIHHIIKSQCLPNKIIDFCQQLVDLNLNPYAHIIAYDSAHAFLRCDLIMAYMNDTKLFGGKLSPEHFSPLLSWQSGDKNESSVLVMFNQMASLDVNPNIETVLPVLSRFGNDSVESVYSKLVLANVPPSVAAGSLLIQSLEHNDFQAAFEKAYKHRIRLDKPFLYEAAGRAYLNTLDAKSLSKLIRLMLDKHANDMTPEKLQHTSEQVVSHLVNQILNLMPEPRIDILQPLFETLLDNRLHISEESRQHLQVKLGDKLTQPVEDLLKKLSSQLLPSSHEKTSFYEAESDIKYEPEEPFDDLIEKIRNKQKLASLTNMYQQMRLNSSSYEENAKSITRILYITRLLVEANRGEEAMRMIEQLDEEEKAQQFGSFDKPHAAARHLMDAAVRNGDVNLVQQLHQSIDSSSLFVMNTDLLSPLIRVHMQRDDLENALMAFEQCASTYLKTPLVVELLIQFIRKGDIVSQQQIIDVSSRVHNEKCCIHYHAFAYLQCGFISSARILFKTPGLRAYPALIDEYCIRWVAHNKENELSNLINITKELFGLDRHRLYHHLLTIYIQTDDVDKALTICARMEEEGIKPSKNFLSRWRKFLKSSNRPDELPAFNNGQLP